MIAQNLKGIFLLIFLTLIFLASSCKSQKIVKIDFVLFDTFLNPEDSLEDIRLSLINSSPADSVFVIGFPLFRNVIEIIPDTLKCKELGIEIAKLDLENSVHYAQETDDILNFAVENNVGQLIYLSNFAKIAYKSKAINTYIYKQKPEIFKHDERLAVKFEIFTINKNKKELIQFIHKLCAQKELADYKLIFN
jgi:hypothetical protein